MNYYFICNNSRVMAFLQTTAEILDIIITTQELGDVFLECTEEQKTTWDSNPNEMDFINSVLIDTGIPKPPEQQ